MFSLPLPVTNLGAGLHSGKTANALGGQLQELIVGAEGLAPGFAGELQALLFNLTPQMLQRLEGLLEGGMALPQAARQLLADATAGAPHGWLQTSGLPMLEPEALIAAAADAKAVAIARPSVPAAMSRLPLELMPATGAVSTAVIAQGGPDPMARPSLPAQLTSSLLGMGIPQPVGGRGWPSALADRVVWMAQGDQQFARLTLNPPKLGPLEVRVSVSQEQTSVTFVAAHAGVRDAIEAAMPRLRDLFDQQSLSLVHAEVADPGSQPERGDAGAADRSGMRSAAETGDLAEDAVAPAQALSGVVARGLIDLFV